MNFLPTPYKLDCSFDELAEREGPEICEHCFHALRLHGPDGCEADRCRDIEGSSEHEWGPCGCDVARLPEEEL